MAAVFCRKCQVRVEEGQPFCARCYTPVKRMSLLRRIFERFVERFGATNDAGVGMFRRPISTTDITVHKSEHFTFHDQNTGEVREFSSFDELPADVRAMIQAARLAASSGGAAEQTIKKRITTGTDGTQQKEITVRGKDGVERRYSSVDELPPEMRRLLDEFRGS